MGLNRRRLRAARTVLRRYPWLRGRSRLASTLLTGSPRRAEDLASLVIPLVEEGEQIRTEDGLVFRARRDPMYLSPMLFGTYEPVLSEIVRRLVRPGDTVIDAGANFGWFTVLFAKLVRPGGRVVAFEPVPHLAELARESIELNAADDVVRLEVLGLGAEEGELTVYTFDQLALGHASAFPQGRDDARAHKCRITGLDDYLDAHPDIGPIDFLKIDVDGFELEVLSGAKRTLSGSAAPVVHFEIAPECLAEAEQSATEVQELLLRCGYTDFWQLGRYRGSKRWEGPIPNRSADYLAATPASRDRVARAAG